jgi:DNA polymerase-3 subunit delta'
MLFRPILGQEPVLRMLRQAHVAGRVHHAYLFAGPDGVGKRRVAAAFAGLCNCEAASPDGAACGSCRMCQRMRRVWEDENPHPDVFRLVPDGRQIKIEQVREVIRRVPFPPIEARFRFVFVEPADLLGEAAANALLKTLEEPPSRTRFVLVSSRPDAVLPTIRSRCQRVELSRLTDGQVREGLARAGGLDAATMEAAVALADGSLGAALALCHDPLMQEREALVARLLGIGPDDALGAMALAGELAEMKDGLPTVFQILRWAYRELLVARGGAGHPGRLGALGSEVASRLGPEALLLRLELLDETARGTLVRNVNPRLSLERLVLALTARPGEETARPGVIP